VRPKNAAVLRERRARERQAGSMANALAAAAEGAGLDRAQQQRCSAE